MALQDEKQEGQVYKLIALDLDGTLTNDEKKVTSHTVDVLHRAVQKGAAIALVSGRPTLGIGHVAAALSLDKIGGYILAYNGGHILDCRTGGDIYKAQFPRTLHDAIKSPLFPTMILVS